MMHFIFRDYARIDSLDICGKITHKNKFLILIWQCYQKPLKWPDI